MILPTTKKMRSSHELSRERKERKGRKETIITRLGAFFFRPRMESIDSFIFLSPEFPTLTWTTH